MSVCVCYLGPGELAQCVQQSLEGSVWNVTFELLQFLFGENLHKVVNVQQDPIKVDVVNVHWEKADNPPKTLNRNTEEHSAPN